MIRDNLKRVADRIALAAERSGRKSSDVKLVGVSKFQPASVISEALDAGLRDFGENYPQELAAKAGVLNDRRIRWHLIGHLQRNKVRKTLPLVASVQSVDSVRLLNALNEAAAQQNIVVPVLLEVNLSFEASKSGFAPGELDSLEENLPNLQNVRFEGLMTLAATNSTPRECHATFARLRELRDRLRAVWGAGFDLPHLSMGMSNDFEIAIAEGATIVRVGSAIFGQRPSKTH